jgi:nitrogen-specific signal transduction histidine kinase
LFIAKQFVEGHGGLIEIESRQKRKDHGTTVRVFLPISTTYDSSGESVRRGLNGQRNAEDCPASA